MNYDEKKEFLIRRIYESLKDIESSDIENFNKNMTTQLDEFNIHLVNGEQMYICDFRDEVILID